MPERYNCIAWKPHTYVFKGTEKVHSILLKAIKQKRKFMIYYDADIDGMLAGSLIALFFKKMKIPYQYYINENRQHGFLLPITEKFKGYTILAVDFAMSKEQIQALTEVGADIVCIDHHETEEFEDVCYINNSNGCEGVLINNQYSFEPEEHRYLSGAGMVYAVFKALFKDFDTKDARAMVGWSLLSDIRQIENEGAAGFLRDTYSWETPIGARLLKLCAREREFGFGEPIIDREFVDFELSPKFNSLFRLNQGDIAIGLFEGTKAVNYSLNLVVKLQKDCIKQIEKTIKTEEYPALSVGYLDIDLIKVAGAYSITNFIGVTASRKVDEVRKTVLYLCEQGGKLVRGSVRGMCDTVDYLSLFKKYGFDCAGHKIAFGLKKIPETFDLEALSAEIAILEKEELGKKNEQITPVYNLGMYKSFSPREVAMYNMFVRTTKKKMFKYMGNNIKITERPNSRLFVVDGVNVQAFDKIMDLDTGYILPVLSKNYLNFYLVKRV